VTAKVIALCVTYQPDLDRFERALRAVAAQVSVVLVLDNSISGDAQAAVLALANQVPGADYVGLWGNRGLGAAYNQGIEMARAQAASYVLLLDQDSIVADDMLQHLLTVFNEPPADDPVAGKPEIRVAACGPRYTDRLTGRRSVLLGDRGISMGRLREPSADAAWATSAMLISSGSLIPMAVLDRLGGFDESFFIDHIDTDFCLRAHAQGMQLLVVSAAGMEHELGHDHQRIWWGHWRELPIHQPQRLYYIFRNSLRLMARPYAPWRWRLFDLRRLGVILGVHLIAPGPRLARVGQVLRGVGAGLLGRGGP